MSLDTPGFTDPVHDSQACFRAVLDAMARPGTINAVTALATPPAPLHRATAAVLLTLVDLDTPLWLDPAARDAAPWIAFHCAAPVADLPAAAFLLALDLPDLAGIHAGTDDGPEDGATLILQLPTLGTGPAWTVEGPGLAAATPFQAPLPPALAAFWPDNHARFPRGFDLILCAGDRLAALPRSLSLLSA